MLQSLNLRSNLLIACLNAAIGRLLSPCCCFPFPLLLRCYLSCSWVVGLQQKDQAHSGFVLAAPPSSRTCVQILPWILNWSANQSSSLYHRGPVALLPKLDFSFLQRSHILRLHLDQHLCRAWHNASFSLCPDCYWNPNNDSFLFSLDNGWHQLHIYRQWSLDTNTYSSLLLPSHCSPLLSTALSSLPSSPLPSPRFPLVFSCFAAS